MYMDKNVIFEDYPYKTDKTIKNIFWAFLIFIILFIILGIIMIIEGVIKNDNEEIGTSILPFALAMMLLYFILSLRNRKLFIYSNHISIYSIFGKEKIYETNTKLMTIHVNYTRSMISGIELTFIDRNYHKICSYTLLEFYIPQKIRT